MKKYIMGQKKFISGEEIEPLLIERGKWGKEDINVSWFSINEQVKLLGSQTYFEIRRNLNSPFDFPILKREVKEVVDELVRRLGIDRDYIRIYFNGKDGFYIYIPMVVTGLFGCHNINYGLRNAAEELRRCTNIYDIRTDIYELDSTHVLFKSKNHETGLYLVSLSHEMLADYTYKELTEYAGNYHKESYHKSYCIDVPDKPLSGLLELMGKIDKDDKDNKKMFIGECSLSKKTVWEESYEELKELYFDSNLLDSIVCDTRADYEHINMLASTIDNETDKRNTIKFNRYSILSLLITRILGPWKHMASTALYDFAANDSLIEHCVCGFYNGTSDANVDLNMYLRYTQSMAKDLLVINESMVIMESLLDMSYERMLNVVASISLHLAESIDREYNLPPMLRDI